MMSKKRKNAMLKMRDAMEQLLFATEEMTTVLQEELEDFDNLNSIFTEDDMDILGEYGELLEMLFSVDAVTELMETDTMKNANAMLDEWYNEHFDEEEGD